MWLCRWQKSKKAEDDEVVSEGGSESDDGGSRRRLSGSDVDSPSTAPADKDRKRKQPRYSHTMSEMLSLFRLIYLGTFNALYK